MKTEKCKEVDESAKKGIKEHGRDEMKLHTLDHVVSRERFPEGVFRTRLAEKGNLPSEINPTLALPQGFFSTVEVWSRSPGEMKK